MATRLISKEKMLDVQGHPLTQSLFLELKYDSKAVYTLKQDDYKFNGKLYPSLRRLYLEHEDPLEYSFANEHLLGWDHWLRLCENKLIRKEIDKWRDELEVKLKSNAIKTMIDVANVDGSFQALKYLAESGWRGKKVGRPSKEDIERTKKIEDEVEKEFTADIIRLRGV